MTERKKRQAVILIHGIGEQHPIVTLREFVESIAQQLKKDNKARPEETVFWDKPDPVSGNFETRKMTMREGGEHPTTDFYEFYWAHHMRDTNWSHIKDWLQRAVFRLPKNVSVRLKPVFFFLWFLISLLLLSAIYYAMRSGVTGFGEKITAITSGFVATMIIGILSGFLFKYLGDAGRYLDPSPGNISERQAIREEGIKFLKCLHESDRYDRIILVSHSLGTAIAYDLIKFLWNEYYKSNLTTKFREAVQQSGREILKDVHASEEAGKRLNGTDEELKAYREMQDKSYRYLKAIGNKWLITDLVTIGSPLTHAGHLFVQEDGLFEKLKDQREYPTCPPHFQAPDSTNIISSEKVQVAGYDHALALEHFNHSSPFAVTKWTNIFYSSDYIGGPLKEVFGQGIQDIELKTQNRIFLYPKGHTHYWDSKNKQNILAELWTILKQV